MDPLSIIGLIAAIQQIINSVYSFGQGVRESKTEINQLCSELLALKAALEHVQLNFSTGATDDAKPVKAAPSPLISEPLATPECKNMIASAESILKDLLARLKVKPNRLKTALQRLSWPLIKDDVKRYVERLHRLTSWFVLATTSGNA